MNDPKVSVGLRSPPAPLPGDTPREPASVPVLMGVPRSGTTLLRMMLDSHPDLAIPPETGFLMKVSAWNQDPSMDTEAFVTAITNHPEEAPTWNDFSIARNDLLQAVRTLPHFTATNGLRCFFKLYASRFNKARWGEKTPDNLFHLEDIHRALPEARFVHILRDPRDVVLSWRKSWFAPSNDLGVLAGEWARRIAVARLQGATVPHYLEIRFEDLIECTESTLRRLCGFLELDFDPAMLQHHLRGAGRLQEHRDRVAKDGTLVASHEQRFKQQRMITQPPDRDRVSAWKNSMSLEEQRMVENAAGPLLEELGYTRYLPAIPLAVETTLKTI